MSECTVVTPPELEPHAVVFSVVHRPTGRVFRCEMTGFEDVIVNGMPPGMNPWADGELRAAVAQAARAHAADNRAVFAPLFEQIAVTSIRPTATGSPNIPLPR